MLRVEPDHERWFRSFSPGGGRRRLFCFPHAGGGPEAFRGWGGGALADTEVLAATLPGHGERMMEKSFAEWPALLAALRSAIEPYLTKPFALFGHSFGARLAFELTRQLQAENAPMPTLLIVSACRCAHVPCPAPLIHELPQPQFYERVRRFSGASAEVLGNAKLMKLFEPALRADVRLCESWSAAARAIRTPIVAFSGAEDETDPPESMREWERYTEGRFAFHTLAGDHFFLRSNEAELLRMISALTTTPRGEAQ
jgi:surfactin synthase thioesterase subunit